MIDQPAGVDCLRSKVINPSKGSLDAGKHLTRLPHWRKSQRQRRKPRFAYRGQIRCLSALVKEMRLAKFIRVKRDQFWRESRVMQPYSKDMILMNTILYLAFPKPSPN